VISNELFKKEKIVKESLIIYIPKETAGISINEELDPSDQYDILTC